MDYRSRDSRLSLAGDGLPVFGYLDELHAPRAAAAKAAKGRKARKSAPEQPRAEDGADGG
jgi:hypothetical protein